MHGHAADAHPAVEVDGDLGGVGARLHDRARARDVPGDGLAGVDVDRRPEDRRARLRRQAHLGGRPQPGEAHAVVLELAVHAEHELARHADLDAPVGVLGADALDRPQRGQKVGVAGRARGVQVDAVGAGLVHPLGDVDDVVHGLLDRLLLGRTRLVDAAQRQQLGPVGHGAVRHRVSPQVRHGAVLARAR